MHEEPVYTAQEVAALLRVHIKTVRRWIASGELVAMDIGKGYRIRKSNLDAFIRKREQQHQQ